MILHAKMCKKLLHVVLNAKQHTRAGPTGIDCIACGIVASKKKSTLLQ